MSEVRVVLQARNDTIGELVEACARKKISFDYLCQRVAVMGYKTTSLFEMVVATEYEIAAASSPSLHPEERVA